MKSSKYTKVIFLDWNGTLSDSLFWDHLKNSKIDEERDLLKIWETSMFSNKKEFINDWMRGKYTTEEVLKNVSTDTKTNYDRLLKEFVKGCESMELSSPQIIPLVHKLQEKGIKVVIATNNMDCFTRWTIPAMKLNIVFDEIINSSDQKALKKDLDSEGKSLFFKDFFTRNKIDMKDCVFIDDSVDHDNTISNMGIKYIQIDSSKELPKILSTFY